MPVTASHLPTVYRPAFGLLTDLYQLTMAAGYYDQRIHERKAIFHLFYRKAPFGGDFAVSAGLALAIDLIQNFRFSADDVQYLGRLKGATGRPLFKETFLNYLQRMRFRGTIHAVPEGEIVMPNEPLLRIEGTLIECQLLETALLTIINFSTLIATKAARVKAAAGEDTVLEFGLRRAQGIDGGLTASRSAYLGGCDATSNVWAGRYYNIPVRGTHAHSWVMAFPSEEDAFAAYAAAMPDNGIFLVDTYDTLEGVRKAVAIGKQLREQGHELLGVRLDSGDLATLSIAARDILDQGGFPEAKIVASDSLDEYAILELKAKGAKIDVWGIGTRLATASDQPALGGVYKLAAIQNAAGEWEPRIKRSNTAIKTSNPGKLNVRYYYDRRDGFPLTRIIYNEFDGAPSGRLALPDGTLAAAKTTNHEAKDLLEPIFINGELCYAVPTLPSTRARALMNWQLWSKRQDYTTFLCGLDPQLSDLKQELLHG
ncbi:MAG: nicotinate phosphoribosyltransferase [Bacteroidota bacterium]